MAIALLNPLTLTLRSDRLEDSSPILSEFTLMIHNRGS